MLHLNRFYVIINENSFSMEKDIWTEAFCSIKTKLQANFKRNKIYKDKVSSWEDHLQDAFCRLWMKKYEIKDKTMAEKLISVTRKNISTDEFRKSKNIIFEDIEKIREPDNETDFMSEKEELFEKIQNIIEKNLTDLQKEIIKLHEYEGMTFEKISQKLKISPAAARMQISRARKTIKEKYLIENETI